MASQGSAKGGSSPQAKKRSVSESTSKETIANENKILRRRVHDLEEQVEHLQSDVIEGLKREVEALKVKLNEVVKVNTRWQAYNDQREEYVKGLHKTVAEMEEEVKDLRKGNKIPEEQQREIDKTLLSLKTRVHELEEEKEKAEDELHKCKRKCSELHDKCKHHEGRLNGMEDHFSRLRIHEERGETEDKDALIALLREQIRIITEDFEAERRDRERAHQRIADLEEEIHILRIQLLQFQEEACSTLARRRQEALGDMGCAGHSNQSEWNPRTGGYDVPDALA